MLNSEALIAAMSDIDERHIVEAGQKLGYTGQKGKTGRKKALRVETTAAEGGDWAEADQEFHLALIKASHNEYMRRLYPIINSAVNEILQITHSRQEMQDIALGDNRLILDFLMLRDEEGARSAMAIHMKHLIQTLGD